MSCLECNDTGFVTLLFDKVPCNLCKPALEHKTANFQLQSAGAGKMMNIILGEMHGKVYPKGANPEFIQRPNSLNQDSAVMSWMDNGNHYHGVVKLSRLQISVAVTQTKT